MEKSQNLLKSVLPSIVRNLRDWIQVDITISLFGEKVFSFTWPPKNANLKTSNHE